MDNGNSKNNEISLSINSDLFDNSSLEILKKADKVNSIFNSEKKIPSGLINLPNDKIKNSLNKSIISESVKNKINDNLVEERLNDEKRIIFDMDFDQMKNFKHYFKHNNCESIIKGTKNMCSSKKRRSFTKNLSIKNKRSWVGSCSKLI